MTTYQHQSNHKVKTMTSQCLNTKTAGYISELQCTLSQQTSAALLTPLCALRLRPNWEGPARRTCCPRNGCDTNCTTRGSCWAVYCKHL